MKRTLVYRRADTGIAGNMHVGQFIFFVALCCLWMTVKASGIFGVTNNIFMSYIEFENYEDRLYVLKKLLNFFISKYH